MDPPVKARGRSVAVAPTAAPDGGYAWFVVLSGFLVFGLTFGIVKAFGVFYVEIHEYFGTAATETSWITSITVATIHIGSPVASALSTRYSHRSVVIVGGLMCGFGVVLGSFARNLVELYLTVGLLNGFGSALTWTPTVHMVGLYFEKKRPLANALTSTGECIIAFVLTPIFQLLIENFTWRGAMMILGGLQLNLCVCGMLLRPLKPPRDVTRVADVSAEEEGLSLELLSKEDSEKPNCQAAKTLQVSEGVGQRTTMTSLEDLDEKSNVSKDSTSRTEGTDFRTKILRYIDYTLITHAQFMVYSMFGVFAALGFYAPALFLVPYARSKGIEEYEAAALVSISSVLDVFGRLFFGWVANLRVVKTVQQLTASVMALGIVLLLCPLASTFTELAVFSGAFGLTYGATVTIHITVLPEVVGVQRLGSALGFFMLIRSSGGLLGPPIAGFFIDKMSDYGTGFLMAGVALFVSALFLLLLHQMIRRGQGTGTKRRDVSKTERSLRDEEKEQDMT